MTRASVAKVIPKVGKERRQSPHATATAHTTSTGGASRSAQQPNVAGKPGVNRVGVISLPWDESDSESELDLTYFAVGGGSSGSVRAIQKLPVSACEPVVAVSACECVVGGACELVVVNACEPAVVTCAVFDVSYSDGDSDWCYDDSSFEPCSSQESYVPGVRVARKHSWGPGTQTDIVMDSGADDSVLPVSFVNHGVAAKPDDTLFADAQGNPLAVRSWWLCNVWIGNTSIKECFMISDVTTPLLASGKLRKMGWAIENVDGAISFTRGGKRPSPVPPQQSRCFCRDPNDSGHGWETFCCYDCGKATWVQPCVCSTRV